MAQGNERNEGMEGGGGGVTYHVYYKSLKLLLLLLLCTPNPKVVKSFDLPWHLVNNIRESFWDTNIQYNRCYRTGIEVRS